MMKTQIEFVVEIPEELPTRKAQKLARRIANKLDPVMDRMFGGHGAMDGNRFTTVINRRNHTTAPNITLETDVLAQHLDFHVIEQRAIKACTEVKTTMLPERIPAFVAFTHYDDTDNEPQVILHDL